MSEVRVDRHEMNQRARENALAAMWAISRLNPRCACRGCSWKRAQIDAFYSKSWDVLFFEEVDGIS